MESLSNQDPPGRALVIFIDSDGASQRVFLVKIELGLAQAVGLRVLLVVWDVVGGEVELLVPS